jgi:predicted dehydrogenase
MTRQDCSTRREFFRGAATASAAAVALPHLVSSSALGKDGTTAPSDRIVMGCIGVGGRGTGNMRVFMSNKDVQVVAVCDADRKHRNRARDLVNKTDCTAEDDFRKVVARKDIDAVSIATPDHWHALISIAAADAGKDIYCEKPLANSVAGGRAICNAVQRNRRILQVGSHERSKDGCRFACELVRNGRIGKLHTIQINMPCDQAHHKKVVEESAVMPPTMPV